MEKIVYVLMTVSVGMVIALHLAMNGKLGVEMSRLSQNKLSAVITVNTFFWVIGCITALSLYLITRIDSPLKLFTVSSKYLFTAGMMGALIVLAVTYLIPDKVGGAGPGFIYLMIGQIIFGMLLSHFGWLGSPIDPMNLKKALGLVLLFAGVYFAAA